MVARSDSHLRLLPETVAARGDRSLVESYRRLADVFHGLLAEQSLDALLVRIADTLADLVPHDSLTIYEADETQRALVAVLARDDYAEEILRTAVSFDEGITGWAARNREPAFVNQAHLDPRVRFVPGTPVDPESLISIPLIARARIKGVLNIYRVGEDGAFGEIEFELAKRFGDAAALALDNAEIRARLEHQARTDSLTGLLNHSVFYERLLHALQDASLTHSPVAVLMLDIDDFKRVNDIHGHGVGDELLRVLAEVLRSCVRPEDAVCRLGGEEFAVIMPGCQAADAQAAAERLRHRLAEVDFQAVGRITLSIGIALGPEHGMNSRELTACAEAAMMTAKAQGKDRVALFAEDEAQRPRAFDDSRDVRSIAHMKMLQSLTGKLNRLNDVRKIGDEIADELHSLIDYHNCRIFVVDGDELVPISFRGELTSSAVSLSFDVLRLRVGEGITGRCAELGESLLIGDAASCEFGHRIPGTTAIEESLLAVPLRFGARTVGVIVVSQLGCDQFDEDDLRLLEILAGHAAAAVENARLYEEARREAESATALLEFGRDLAAQVGLDRILESIVEQSTDILGARRTAVWLEAAEGRLVPRAFDGFTPADRRAVEVLDLPASNLDLEREAYVLRPEDYAAMMPDPPLPGVSYAVAPFELEGRRGCITAAIADEGFGERELRVFGAVAQQAKLALANASSYEGLERTFVSTVEALANALEANDEYTSTHARWITDLALRVGREFGLDELVLKRLELGALLHDIGKIGVPEAILSKPGRLTASERALMERHPELGERIIAPIDRLQDVRPIVRHCHERWDGGGYPDGLAGEEIPLEARIIFVCDAYHAMTTTRSYRRSLGHREAARRLAAGAGSQFDPRVVDVVLAVLGG